MITYQTCSSAETKKLGERLAKKILARGTQKQAVVVGLSGGLGSGKTTFIQGFFRGIGIGKRALSPTFIIMRRLELKNGKFKSLFHIDAYRLRKPKELLELGLREALRGPENVILIEWADKLKRVLPRNAIWVNFTHGKKENQRTLRTSIPICK
ncbi:MAG: tRNA (adenosine(37)-N6)-threonylcarbamoyltransferase complex ATPase subunit type 1 TsaE [Candidatus Liptonbacteria bacterium]|nr:tRNA (adenosine(37)-N6)-threonylcarbamoyltransferase complex ATPase subunit type 1 TsaE [Candidatus Liptonbacteria bacterium]